MRFGACVALGVGLIWFWAFGGAGLRLRLTFCLVLRAFINHKPLRVHVPNK